MGRRLYAWLMAAFALSHAAESQAKQAPPPLIVFGDASWYGRYFEGRRTADGHHFHAAGSSAASLMFPLGTWVRITNLSNGRSVITIINDRGPYVHGRLIDVSLGVAIKLDMVLAGVVRVRIDQVEPPSPLGIPR